MSGTLLKLYHSQRRMWQAVLWLLLSCSAYTALSPVSALQRTPPMPQTFSHAAFDRVLQRFVNDTGRVDYTALQQQTGDLEQYSGLLATYSPDSHPELFPTEHDRLAYWINAYNAAAITNVLAHYPIASVADVRRPWAFFFLPRKSGFFLFQRLTLGGATTSLYTLENRVIRKRFDDPRIHFALNCASLGCPHLPQHTFRAADLETQLDRETRAFVAEARNVRIDHATNTVWLSEIFKWYKKDFLGWYRRAHPQHEATLLHYITAYLPADKAAELQQAAPYRIRFVPYDWCLNDQRENDCAAKQHTK